MTSVALTIAGSDPSGGAGIQADLKTFHQHGVYGMSVITLLTVQNTQTVSRVEVLSPELVRAQLEAVISDISPQAAKTGALGNAAVITTVAEIARQCRFPLVVDPVMVSKHGAPLIDTEAVDTLKEKLLPLAYLVTPNLHEAGLLTGMEVTDEITMVHAMSELLAMGPRNVLIKGGHLEGEALDLLWCEGKVYCIRGERIETTQTHGTGCVYSAAITAHLAHGRRLVDAVYAAKAFVTEAIRSNPSLGRGYGPVNMFVTTGLEPPPST